MANRLLFLVIIFYATTTFFTQLAVVADPDDIIYAGCSQSKYDEGSAYESNVNSLLASIANAASNSPYAKFTSDTASPSSPVYGLFQCRGDLSTSDCQNCVRSALSHLPSICPSASGAAVQLDGCLVRYSGDSFFGKQETNLLYKKCGSFPPNGYDANLAGMRDDALGTIGGNGGTYRFGTAGYVQAAAQCVGDLSAKDCSDCISNAISQLKTVCGDAVSGDVYLGKCFAKYYSSSTPFSSSSSPFGDYHHHDSSNESGKTLAIILGLLAGIALIIIFASFIRRAGDGK